MSYLLKSIITVLFLFNPHLLTNLSFAEGNISEGKKKSTTCVACHGLDGNSPSSAFPSIAGQGERYLITQITAIINGDRLAPVMAPMVQYLKGKDQDIADIAAYYASQTPKPTGATDPDKVTLGEQIYRAGNSETGVPACMSCHGPSGQGVASAGFPRLAGQYADYTKAQLNGWRLHTEEAPFRSTAFGSIMIDIAKKMHEHEIEAVASYLQGLRE